MIKVFIAEDQPLILQDLSNKITAARSDIALAGTARNGEEALRRILETAPDIVFTDIKMPRLSGLAMMERVKEQLPRTKFVIISGYQDYEYMHKALQLDADEYLLKPVASADISHVLDHVCAKILLGKKQYERIRVGEILTSSERDQVVENLGFSCNSYRILVLNAGPCATYGMDYTNPFSTLWEEIDVEELARKFLLDNEKVYCYDGKSVNEKVLFVGLCSPSAPFLQAYCQALLDAAEKSRVSLTIGISRDVRHLANIGVESQVVRTLLRKNLVFAKSGVLYCDNAALFRQPYSDELSQADKKELLHNLDCKRSALPDQLFGLLDRAERQQYTQMHLLRLLEEILRLCLKGTNLSEGEDYRLALEEALCNADSYALLKTTVLPVYLQCISPSAEPQGDVSVERLQRAREYIRDHFQDVLSINEIANQFHIAPTYFSKMFKKEFGITAIEFLTQCRIEHAKNLLKQKQYSIHEIADLCGYSDPYYFSRIFKAETGISPSKYIEV